MREWGKQIGTGVAVSSDHIFGTSELQQTSLPVNSLSLMLPTPLHLDLSLFIGQSFPGGGQSITYHIRTKSCAGRVSLNAMNRNLMPDL